MEAFKSLAEGIKQFLTCGKGNKRARDSSYEDELNYTVKRRRLSQPQFTNYPHKETYSLDNHKNVSFKFKDDRYRKNNQSQIIKANHLHLNILSSLSTNKTKSCKKRLDFNYDRQTGTNADKENYEKKIKLNFSFSDLENNFIRSFDNNFNNIPKPSEFIIEKEISEQNQSYINLDEAVKIDNYEEINLLSESNNKSEEVYEDCEMIEHDSSETDSNIIENINSGYNIKAQFYDLNKYITDQNDGINYPQISYKQFERLIT